MVSDKVVGRGLATARDVWSQIPKSWQDCPIAIGDSIGSAVVIRRISLHQDSEGNRVILLHDEKMKVRGTNQ